jgi:uncharacterized protein YggE
MKVRVVILAAVLTTLAAAQQRQQQPAIPNDTIYVGADGKFESIPDTALIQFSISAQERTTAEAYDRASRAAEQIRNVLRSNKIDPKSAEMGFYSVEPVYDHRNPKRRLVGYRVNSSVQLKLKDFAKIGTIAQQLAEMDVTQTQSISYMLEDMDAAKAKAVQDALRRARGSATAAAQAGGRKVGDLIYASVDAQEPVPLIMRGAMDYAEGMMAQNAAAPAPTAEFTAQKITVTARVNALFELQ